MRNCRDDVLAKDAYPDPVDFFGRHGGASIERAVDRRRYGFGSEAPPPPVTPTFAVLAGVGAIVGGLKQWVELPLPGKEEESKGKARASSMKPPSK